MISALEDFKTYNLAMDLGKQVWNIVNRWGYFEKDTIGKQFVRAADSVAANLSEGLGRFQYKETRNFSYFSRGSLFETRTWISKSFKRNLISKEEFENLESAIEITGKMINNYINSIGQVMNYLNNTQYLTPNT